MPRLGDIGERELIARIRSIYRQHGVLGDELDDDCGAVRSQHECGMLVTSDRAPQFVWGELLGRLLVTQSVSDLLSSGAEPHSVLIGFVFPYESQWSEAKQVVEAAADQAHELGVIIIGGDTKEGLEWSGFGVGLGNAARRWHRRGARPGDSLCVTLTGGTGLGMRPATMLTMLEGEIGLSPQLSANLKAAWTHPQLPIRAARALRQGCAVTAAMDMSDGLGAILQAMTVDSGCGVLLEAEAMYGAVDARLAPLADRLGIPLGALACAPGYDWELAVALSPMDTAAAVEAVNGTGDSLHRLGEFTDRPGIRLRHHDGSCKKFSVVDDEKFSSRPWSDLGAEWLRTQRAGWR